MPVVVEQPKVDASEVEMKRKLELLAKVRQGREASVLDRSKLKGLKPNKQYAWVNVNQDRQVEYQGTGYILCTDKDITSPWRKQDGTHVRGDLILYEIDVEYAEALDFDSQLRAIEVTENREGDFLEFAAQRGFPARKVERKE